MWPESTGSRPWLVMYRPLRGLTNIGGVSRALEIWVMYSPEGEGGKADGGRQARPFGRLRTGRIVGPTERQRQPFGKLRAGGVAVR